jgi:hypothetical protein
MRRKRENEGINRRKGTLIKKAYELGEFDSGCYSNHLQAIVGTIRTDLGIIKRGRHLWQRL